MFMLTNAKAFIDIIVQVSDVYADLIHDFTFVIMTICNFLQAFFYAFLNKKLRFSYACSSRNLINLKMIV